MAHSDSASRDNVPALLVLSNAELFRGIVSWSVGCPALVANRWHELKAARGASSSYMGTDQFMWHLIWQYDLRTLELTRHVTYAPRARARVFKVTDVRPAIKAGDANAVRLAFEFATIATDWLRREYWALAIEAFPGHCEVLDELDMFEPLEDAEVRRASTTWARHLVKADSVVLIEWLIQNVGADCLPKDMMHAASLRGNLALVRLLKTVDNQVIPSSTFHALYQLHADNPAGDYKAILTFLLEHRSEPHTSDLEVSVMEAGDHATLAVIQQRRGLQFLQGVSIDKAAGQGHLQVIQLLASCVQVKCTREAMDSAAANGHLDVLQFLHSTNAVGATPLAMDRAAANGHFEIVQFLHHHRKEGCYKTAMAGAAAIGRLDIVQFLHYNRREGCTAKALDQAAMNGHLDVVQFLHEHRKEGCTSAAFTYPRPTSKRIETHRQTLIFLFEHRTEKHPKSLEDDALRYRDLELLRVIQRTRGLQYLQDVNVDDIAGEGNLELLQFLEEHAAVTCTVTAMDTAAAKGHLEVVRFLHETRTEGCTTAAMDMAATFGHWEIVEFLHENRQEGGTSVVLNTAVRLGRLDLVAKYSKRASRLNIQAAVYIARAHGHDGVRGYLQNCALTA